MDYSSYKDLKVRSLEPGILEIVMGEEGKLAVATANGGMAKVLALSYGERGESGELWKDQDSAHPQTIERVKEARHGEASRASAVLGEPRKATRTWITARRGAARRTTWRRAPSSGP